MNAIITVTIVALIALVCIPVAYIAPKAIDFVKSFIKWHFHD